MKALSPISLRERGDCGFISLTGFPHEKDLSHVSSRVFSVLLLGHLELSSRAKQLQ
jgi:hypothetical protein